MISLGIDTGGTYTDAAAVDLVSGRVLAKGKSPTTRENLVLGIAGALGTLPPEIIDKAEMVALSTTLATNACVENKGGRAKLLLCGMTDDFLRRIDAESKFGLKAGSVMCVDTHGSYDGTFVDVPDWERLFLENKDWFRDADALSVAELFVFNSGAACEKRAREIFEDTLGIPIILASELATEVNILERGATALLNARLLPVVKEFIGAVRSALGEKSRDPRMMVVRSDSSLMTMALAQEKPVETILSGPAASTMGGMYLSGSRDCAIVDIGGTTTDISIVRGGEPKLAGSGISIGGWRTQIKGVYVDTFALGGDSAVRLENGGLTLKSRRVLPVCFAAKRWPGIKSELRALLDKKIKYYRDFHEMLCLVREPEEPSRYSEQEHRLIDALRSGPRMIDSLRQNEGISKYRLDSERLESEGIIIRSGLTPTDMMHILGDYVDFDCEASELAARFFMMNLAGFEDREPADLAREVYELVCEKLYVNIVRVFLEDRYPKMFDAGLDKQLEILISSSWRDKDPGSIIRLGISTPCVLVGAGAPTHLFLPRVAEALGTRCVMPEHAEVANAIGAALADIKASARADIEPIIAGGVVTGYAAYTQAGRTAFKSLEEAKDFAIKAAEAEAEREARRRGAVGELHIEASIGSQNTITKDGVRHSFGMHARAAVTGGSPIENLSADRP